MADYDTSGLTSDSGVFYDAPFAPQLETKKMAKVKLGLGTMSPDDVLLLANQIVTAMTGNANFPTPNPTLAAVSTALVALLTSLGDHVSNVSSGNRVKIESAGMGVKASNAPIGPLPQVQNLSITAGDAEGRLDLQWDPVHGTKNYQVQMSTDPNVPANWKLVDSCSGSKLSLTGLTSGQKLWFRVKARAPKAVNDGAWSDPATKIVP